MKIMEINNKPLIQYFNKIKKKIKKKKKKKN